MNSKYFVIALAPAIALTVAQNADARFGFKPDGHHRGGFQAQMQDIQRSVEKLQNGVQITISADDADSITKIQSRHADKPPHADENINHAVANTANGVVLTLTSDDAETVAKMHERADNPRPFKGHGPRGKNHPPVMENVERQVTLLDNGAKIALTSNDSEVVEKLQNRPERSPKNEDQLVKFERTKVSNGIEIIITADDAETIKQIQNRAQQEPGQRDHSHLKDVEKEVTNLENGVQVTLTSTEAEVVEKLQAKEPRQSRNQEISITKTNIQNGVQLTITTDNQDLVERIQNRADRKGKPGFGRGGRKGFGKRH